MKHTYSQILKVAEPEGWSVVYTHIQDATHNKYELQRLGDMPIFKSDNEAIQHVVQKAILNPNSIHASAIKFLAKESPNEVDSIIRTAVNDGTFLRLLSELKIKL